jgi:hypothetical protein
MLRKEHLLRVLENRVQRGMFGPKRDEVTGGWRKLCSDELHIAVCFIMHEVGRACGTTSESVYTVLGCWETLRDDHF